MKFSSENIGRIRRGEKEGTVRLGATVWAYGGGSARVRAWVSWEHFSRLRRVVR